MKYSDKLKTKLGGFSPQANYTDRARHHYENVLEYVWWRIILIIQHPHPKYIFEINWMFSQHKNEELLFNSVIHNSDTLLESSALRVPLMLTSQKKT
jgi:hypothetical protein